MPWVMRVMAATASTSVKPLRSRLSPSCCHLVCKTKDFLATERLEMVDETHPEVELGVAGELLSIWHADEHQANLATVVDVPHLLQAGRFQTIGLVDDDEFRHIRYVQRQVVVASASTTPRIQ